MKCEYVMQQSPMPQYQSVCKLLLLTFLFLTTLLVSGAQAQMFSVGSAPGRVDIPRTAIYLGLEPADFEYTGDPGDINSERYEFNGSLLRLRLETSGLSFFLATGGSITGIDDVSYFDAGVEAKYGITLYRKEALIIQLPVQIISSLTSVSSDRNFQSSSQFQQGSLAVGAGAFAGVRPADNFRFQLGFIPHYGFSFATGGTFGGSLAKLDGRFRLFFDRLFGDVGLSLGYNYKFDSFDVDENEFDYDLTSHSILVGITF